jgi:hypothetical protein
MRAKPRDHETAGPVSTKPGPLADNSGRGTAPR